jgi:cellulose synthase/poly-beta-1,6-N-acetylglucosamine synthase-like glycosyltransferase
MGSYRIEAGEISLLISGVAILVQLYYFLIVFSKLAFYKNKAGTSQLQPVSVIICARNELVNLKQNLELVLKQDYPLFQVIVVNDCSWDETGKFLEEQQQLFSHLKVVTIKEQEKYRHGKKFALSLGIKAALHEVLLHTDADCKPASDQWIRLMVEKMSQGKEIVIGYGAYKKIPGLINKWIRMDTALNAIQYLSFALNKTPYMGVGRNLMYTKTLFFRNKGFASHNHILSGDDDLFINQTALSHNTAVEIRPESFTYSHPKSTWKSWIHQKKRHLSTSKYYKTSHKLSLGLFFMTILVFYAGCAVAIVLGYDLKIVIAIYLFRLIVQLLIFGRCMKKLGELDIIWMVPIFDVVMVIVYPFIMLSSLLFKQKTWK